MEHTKSEHEFLGGTPAQGSIKWFDPVKGFGFVLIDSCNELDFVGQDALLHEIGRASVGKEC